MQMDPMHAARLAQLEGALLSLLVHSQADAGPHDEADGVSATLDDNGLAIEYTRGGVAVAGESL